MSYSFQITFELSRSFKFHSVSPFLSDVIVKSFLAMESAALPLLTRLPRVDCDGTEYNYVLLHVSSTGDQTFDLKLIGTESTEVFSLKGKEATGSTRSDGPLTSNFMR